MSSSFKKGFYGGKFMPFHKGHMFCIDYAASLCDELHVILFTDTVEEEKLTEKLRRDFPEKILLPKYRKRRMKKYCRGIDNVSFSVIDDDEVRRNISGSSMDLWDAETAYVLSAAGRFDAVFSSEPSYGEYFERAYPWAEQIVIDEKRLNVPISGTQIRNMNADDVLMWI